jgi:hypothetical protein
MQKNWQFFIFFFNYFRVICLKGLKAFSKGNSIYFINIVAICWFEEKMRYELIKIAVTNNWVRNQYI